MAPPFGSSLANDLDFFNSLPPLESKRSPEPCSFLPSEPVEAYCLAIVDDSGEVVRAATTEDLVQLNLLEDASPGEPPSPQKVEHKAEAVCPEAYFKELLSKGPVCRHCGVTESPQWRRGPPNKPILCNACGTRYRRTGQLNHAAQNPNRKRLTPSDCAREMVGEKARVMKQPRMVA
ncbi:hypothetical protein N2152v2_003406 [Parachlorella kessleri]